MTQAQPTKHTDAQGHQYNVAEPLLPDLKPGEMRTTLPERWCGKCGQLRPKRTCAVCGQQTTKPPSDVIEQLGAAAGDRVPVHVVELDGASAAAFLPPELELPADPDDDEPADVEPAASAPGGAPPWLDDEPLDDGPGDEDDEPAELDDEDDDDEPAELDDDEPAAELAPGAELAPAPSGGRLGLPARLAAAARTRATDGHVATEDLTRRERLIAGRAKGPMARSIQEKARFKEWQPLSERNTRRNQPMTARPMSSRARDVDERGREVQRTEGRTKTRSVEDQLIGLWEKATINTSRWDIYFAAAMQQVQYDAEGKPFSASPEEAADTADQMYIQLLVREKYATG